MSIKSFNNIINDLPIIWIFHIQTNCIDTLLCDINKKNLINFFIGEVI